MMNSSRSWETHSSVLSARHSIFPSYSDEVCARELTPLRVEEMRNANRRRRKYFQRAAKGEDEEGADAESPSKAVKELLRARSDRIDRDANRQRRMFFIERHRNVRNERSPESAKTNRVLAASVVIVACLCTWLSASAVSGELIAHIGVSENISSLLTVATQSGFLISAVMSAFCGLTDRIEPRLLVSRAALLGSLANAAVTFVPEGFPAISFSVAAVLRFVVGCCVAQIYPTSMKILSSWVPPERRRVTLSSLLGIVCMAVAVPQIIRSVAPWMHWRQVMWLVSIFSACGAAASRKILCMGPFLGVQSAGNERSSSSSSSSSSSALNVALRIVRDPTFLLGTIAKSGHDWELYGFWTQIRSFFDSYTSADGDDEVSQKSALAASACIAMGAIGCYAAGHVANRFGSLQTIVAICVVSGSMSCVLSLSRFLVPSSFALAFGFAAIWGLFVVADSALYSTIIINATGGWPKSAVGNALSMQMAISTGVSVIAVFVVPTLVRSLGWELAIGSLSIGPLVSVLCAVALLRRKRSDRAHCLPPLR